MDILAVRYVQQGGIRAVQPLEQPLHNTYVTPRLTIIVYLRGVFSKAIHGAFALQGPTIIEEAENRIDSFTVIHIPLLAS